MTLVLSNDDARGGAAPKPAARVGIINIMPRAETYEGYLLAPLERAATAVRPVWIRLESHRSSSSDGAHVDKLYVPFGEALKSGPLDGLILTGAPVEELAFEDVSYWRELAEILGYARRAVRSTLGLCWGGLALGYLLGLEKESFSQKLFGVYANRSLDRTSVFTGDLDDEFDCAQSRHSGIDDRALEAARDAGTVTLLSHGEATGYSIFESRDHRYLAHLGHAEYEPSRLVDEWKRDVALGRADVARPHGFDVDAPKNTWRSHRNELFGRWLAYVANGPRTT